MTVHLVISLPKTPCIHRIYVVMANATSRARSSAPTLVLPSARQQAAIRTPTIRTPTSRHTHANKLPYARQQSARQQAAICSPTICTPTSCHTHANNLPYARQQSARQQAAPNNLILVSEWCVKSGYAARNPSFSAQALSVALLITMTCTR